MQQEITAKIAAFQLAVSTLKEYNESRKGNILDNPKQPLISPAQLDVSQQKVKNLCKVGGDARAFLGALTTESLPECLYDALDNGIITETIVSDNGIWYSGYDVEAGFAFYFDGEHDQEGTNVRIVELSDYDVALIVDLLIPHFVELADKPFDGWDNTFGDWLSDLFEKFNP